jgi:hypothetical protein
MQPQVKVDSREGRASFAEKKRIIHMATSYNPELSVFHVAELEMLANVPAQWSASLRTLIFTRRSVRKVLTEGARGGARQQKGNTAEGTERMYNSQLCMNTKTEEPKNGR